MMGFASPNLSHNLSFNVRYFFLRSSITTSTQVDLLISSWLSQGTRAKHAKNNPIIAHHLALSYSYCRWSWLYARLLPCGSSSTFGAIHATRRNTAFSKSQYKIPELRSNPNVTRLYRLSMLRTVLHCAESLSLAYLVMADIGVSRRTLSTTGSHRDRRDARALPMASYIRAN